MSDNWEQVEQKLENIENTLDSVVADLKAFRYTSRGDGAASVRDVLDLLKLVTELAQLTKEAVSLNHVHDNSHSG